MNNYIQDKLDAFYLTHHLGEDGGNNLPYVRLEIGKFFNLYIPNWDGRRVAVLKHDIHHLLTHYPSELFGEFEIAAWEIGSGCSNYFAVYLLNSSGLLMGLFIHTKATFQAFLRGCRTKNLYSSPYTNEELIHFSEDVLAKELLLDKQLEYSRPTTREFLRFGKHIILSFFLQMCTVFIIPLLILYNIWIRCFTDYK